MCAFDKQDISTAWVSDQMHILAPAIRNAGSIEAHSVSKSILDLRGFTGLEGRYEFDEKGAGLYGYNVLRNEGGRIVFICRRQFATPNG